MNPTPTLFVKMALDAWNIHIQRADKLLAELSDDQLLQQVAPGKNRGIYLLGHLTAIHDKMLALLSLGTPRYPELFAAFVDEPDSTKTEIPDIAGLREKWKSTNDLLSTAFKTLTPEDWFKKHEAVNEEDFKKEPHRNRLNLVINRTNHLSYHYGQMILLKKN